MKRETVAWFPSVLLCQKMNIADPTKCKEDTRKSEPFSLLSHVNPFAGTKQREKEFEKPIKCEDEVIANAYVPPKPIERQPLQLPAAAIEESVTIENEIEQVTVKKAPVVAFKPTPKTDLEISIQKHVNSHPSEKKDIYKAIFESSDDEDEPEENETTTFNVVPAPTPFIPSRLAEDINILRNTSPPRGIFSSLADKRAKSPVPEPPIAVTTVTNNKDSALYGPSLPVVPLEARPSADRAPVFIPSSAKRHRISSSSDSSQSDEWIAKDERPSQDRSHSKKHKRLKTKHKKSKSTKSKKSKKSKKSHRWVWYIWNKIVKTKLLMEFFWESYQRTY